ncbi:EndoU domain-containing protein [Janthinobacterium fluminis]|uniref:EndoU domain-containing protein n=1 Tax=Janthinobacterium fluminis TaxID=2987524 RepID=A0ABT5JX25_9BURK|nr:EndoU domain-containing protein [Janthinobacterium fluminis]MDC8756611.1 EndoU domain-containing protein [Janthinobacterium fluminis]
MDTKAVVYGRYYIDEVGKTHILDGDATGGGHRYGTGHPGKSEFPQTWSDEKILNAILDVANDSASSVTPGRGGRSVIKGTRDGIDITVVVEPSDRTVTGFPTNTPKN